MKRRTQKKRGGMISLHYIRIPSLSSCARNDTVRVLSTRRNTYYFVRVRLYDLSAGLSAVEWRRWTRHYEPNDLYEKKDKTNLFFREKETIPAPLRRRTKPKKRPTPLTFPIWGGARLTDNLVWEWWSVPDFFDSSRGGKDNRILRVLYERGVVSTPPTN